MPCTQTGSLLGDAQLSAQEANENATKLARMLCATLTLMEKQGDILLDHLNNETEEWWKEHKEIDRKRISKEKKENLAALRKRQVRKSALSKLSEEEKTALGY